MRDCVCKIAFASYLMMFAGCAPSVTTVSGNVTIDGFPVDQGTISFVPAEGSGTPVSAEIKAGKYTATMPTGKKKVQISAPGPSEQRPAFNDPSAPMIEVPGVERLPATYHANTTLEYEAKGSSATKDWPTSTK